MPLKQPASDLDLFECRPRLPEFQEFDIRKQRQATGPRGTQQRVEILGLEAKIPGIVKVIEASVVRVQAIDTDRGLAMRGAIADASCLRKREGTGFGQGQPATPDLRAQVVFEAVVDRQFEDLDAV